MQKFKKFALKSPTIFGLVLMILYPLLATLTYPVHFLFPETEVGQVYGDALARLVIVIVFVVILWRFGWLRASGISRTGSFRFWPLIALLLVYHLLVNLYTYTGDLAIVWPRTPLEIANLVNYFPGSLMEEIIFRGVILLAMVMAWGNTKAGLAKAVVYSSLMFGSLHLVNLAVLPPGVVLLQVVGAAMLGIFWAALVLTTRSLWPAILLHYLTNAAVNVKLVGLEGFQETVTIRAMHAISLLPLLIIGAYLLWKLPQGQTSEPESAVAPTWNPGTPALPGD